MEKPDLLATIAVLGTLAAIVGFGLTLILRARSDLQREPKAGPGEMLADLEAAYRRGQMDSAEFDRVCRSIERKTGRPVLQGTRRPPRELEGTPEEQEADAADPSVTPPPSTSSDPSPGTG
jgi:hypothetical protein